MASDEEIAAVDRLFKAQTRPAGLREAVGATLKLRRILSYFRNNCLSCVEVGELFETVKAWYVQNHSLHLPLTEYPKSLKERNPYAQYRRSEGKKMKGRWSSQLDFLMSEIPYNEPGTWKVELLDTEREELVAELTSPGSRLASLITVCPYLTHGENVNLAVLEARLWVCNSELMVDFTESSGTYKAIRAGDAPARRQSDGQPPSPYLVCLKAAACCAHLSRKSVVYLTPLDFDEKERGCSMARMSRVGLAVGSLARGTTPREVAKSVAISYEDEDEVKESFLETIKDLETPAVAEFLALRVYDTRAEEFSALAAAIPPFS